MFTRLLNVILGVAIVLFGTGNCSEALAMSNQSKQMIEVEKSIIDITPISNDEVSQNQGGININEIISLLK